MFDGSPRRRKGIKCGSATDMENNMDGTGRDMENMTMTVPNTADTAMTNTNMEMNKIWMALAETWRT